MPALKLFIVSWKRLFMVTIKDVAREAGVSVATVSRVINNEPRVSQDTKSNVSAVMKRIGYRPNANARALVTKKSTTLGVVIPELQDPFFAALSHGADKVARNFGMQLLLSTGLRSAQSERDALELLLERRCDAIVMHSKNMPEEELTELCATVPGLIIIDRYIEAIADRCVWLDNYEGGRAAARHLLALGHKNIACISTKSILEDPVQRLEGFVEVLKKEANISIPEHLIEYAESNQLGGELAAKQLLAKQALAKGAPITAIFVFNDAMAIGVITSLIDSGLRVPEDISIVGFDDVLLARYSRPKLTTLRYPIEEMAEQAALLALKYRNNKEVDPTCCYYKYVPTFITRESTIAVD